MKNRQEGSITTGQLNGQFYWFLVLLSQLFNITVIENVLKIKPIFERSTIFGFFFENMVIKWNLLLLKNAFPVKNENNNQFCVWHKQSRGTFRQYLSQILILNTNKVPTRLIYYFEM